MADVQPLRALHYDPAKVGGRSQAVVAPPYDVIDPEQRAELAARSPYNVVAIDLPEAETEGGDPYAHAAELLERWQADGARRPRRGAGDLGARPGLHRPGRRPAHAPRAVRARARRGLRPRPDPPARAHAPGPARGPPAPHARDEGEPVADLQPLLRPRGRGVGRGRGGHRAAPFGEATDDDGTRNRLWRVADPGADRAGPGDAGGRRAAHRRRPPPLRDRPRVRRRGRRRGRAPLRADVPRRARGPGPDRLPHPPPRSATTTSQHPGGARERAAREYFDVTPIEHAELRPPDGDGPLDDGLHRRPLQARVPAHAARTRRSPTAPSTG